MEKNFKWKFEFLLVFLLYLSSVLHQGLFCVLLRTSFYVDLDRDGVSYLCFRDVIQSGHPRNSDGRNSNNISKSVCQKK